MSKANKPKAPQNTKNSCGRDSRAAWFHVALAEASVGTGR